MSYTAQFQQWSDTHKETNTIAYKEEWYRYNNPRNHID